jgi:Tfp pilus assembly protein PilF
MRHMTRWFKGLALTLTLALTGLALFQFCWSSPYVLDDLTKIEQNMDLRVPFSLHSFIYPYAEASMHFRNDPSRPLTYMVYWVCWQLGQGSPTPFHVVTSVTHILCALLLAFSIMSLLQGLLGKTSYLAGAAGGLLFLTSPLMAGTAVYAYGLSDVLGTCFLLLGFLVGYRGTGRLAGLLTALAFALALGAKQSAIVLPALLAAADLFTQRKFDRSRLQRIYLPLVALAVAYVAFRFMYFGALGDLEGTNDVVPRLDYFLSQGVMIFRYLQLTLWPHPLTVDHREIPWQLPIWQMLGGWLLIVGLSLWSGWVALKRSSSPTERLLGLGWCLYLICLLPVSSLFPTVDLFVERRAYSADMGVYLIIAGLLVLANQKWARWRALLWSVVITALVAQTAVTYAREDLYRSPDRLWQEALELDPQNPRALINLGVYFSSIGRFNEARRVYEDLLQLQPQNGAVYSKLGFIYMQSSFADHSLEKAQFYFQTALRFGPNNIFALFNYGVLMMQTQRYDMAEQLFARAAQLAPQMTQALVAAGNSARLQNQIDRAEHYFTEALKQDPNSPIIQQALKSLHR